MRSGPRRIRSRRPCRLPWPPPGTPERSPVSTPLVTRRCSTDLAMGWLQRQLGAPTPAAPGEAQHLIAFALAALEREAPPQPEVHHGA